MKSTSLQGVRSMLLRVAAWSALSLAPAVRAQDAPADPPSDPPGTAAPAGSAERDPADSAENQEKFRDAVEKLGWTRNGRGALGQWADIEVPKGYRFTSANGARKLLQMYGNLVGTSEQGLLAPESLDWFIVFDFDAVGYVKDDEKDQLDADAILKQKKEGEKLANDHKKKAGLPLLFIDGWIVKPHYDEKTHNLEWGLKLRSEEGGESVNYNLKLLGRSGVMDATLVCDPAKLESVLPQARTLLAGFQFQSGQTYAEYRKGDKIAEYGLTALVLGGGAALAAKSGLFAVIGKFFGKFFKLIIIGAIAFAAGIKKFFGKLFGRGDSPDRGTLPPPPPPPPPPV